MRVHYRDVVVEWLDPEGGRPVARAIAEVMSQNWLEGCEEGQDLMVTVEGVEYRVSQFSLQ